MVYYPVALISFLAASALAHMQLSDPLPIRSSLDPSVPNDSKDYSYTAPLVSNGLPYPCKGYLNSDASLMKSKKTWAAGSTQSYTVVGTAVHGGGSCQVSLSYDMGKTWNVIQSLIGGCMMEGLTESFTIPSGAPSGEAIFSWSWFNNLGNREMYQNCVPITVTNGGSGLNSRDHPAPFVANAGSVNSCSTVDSRDVVFPNPGAAVTYSGGFKGTVPAAGLNVIGTGCSHPGGADGAGTRAGSGGGSIPAKELLSPASSSAAPAALSSTSTAQVSAAATTAPAVLAPGAPATAISSATSIVAPSASASSPSPVAAAPAATTTAVRTCRRRRSNTKKSLIPASELQAHRARGARRHGGFVPRRMDPESRSQSGRVAALPAGRPVYAAQS